MARHSRRRAAFRTHRGDVPRVEVRRLLQEGQACVRVHDILKTHKAKHITSALRPCPSSLISITHPTKAADTNARDKGTARGHDWKNSPAHVYFNPAFYYRGMSLMANHMLSTLRNDNQIQTCTSSIKTESWRAAGVCVHQSRAPCALRTVPPAAGGRGGRGPWALLGRALKSKRLFEVAKTAGRPAFSFLFPPHFPRWTSRGV